MEKMAQGPPNVEICRGIRQARAGLTMAKAEKTGGDYGIPPQQRGSHTAGMRNKFKQKLSPIHQ